MGFVTSDNPAKRRTLCVLYEDESSLGMLRQGLALYWVSLVFLVLIFLPVVALFLFLAIRGSFNIPGYVRLFFGYGAVFIINIFFASVLQKPVTVYREGIDIGTVGSIGIAKILIAGCIFYFMPTTFLDWSRIKRIERTTDARGGDVLVISDSAARAYRCPLAAKQTSFKEIIAAAGKVQQQDKIAWGN